MIWIAHPTGNSFVRALLAELRQSGIEHLFHTTLAINPVAWWARALPPSWRRELQRRAYDVPPASVRQRPGRELARLLCHRIAGEAATRLLPGISADAVYRDLDQHVAALLRQTREPVQAVYAYEDGARDTFLAARSRGVVCGYELPIAYWESSQRLLQEEAQRWPAWVPTLGASSEAPEKLDRKTEELSLADVVVCPSNFVYRSLPEEIRRHKHCVVAEFGSPPPPPKVNDRRARNEQRLRVLFAGSMTQRKGLADLFAAMKLLRRSNAELVVMGSALLPLSFYRKQLDNFVYEAPRSHEQVLALMDDCDVLVLPSIVEGRALVQQEALSRGLPLIITPNTGGEDLIVPGQTGFVVPIRDPERLADQIAWFADHRSELEEMRAAARQKAAQFSWARYGQAIVNACNWN